MPYLDCNNEDWPSCSSIAASSTAPIHTPTSTASKSKATIPFLSFSSKSDPRLKSEKEGKKIAGEMEHSEDENLIADPRSSGLPKKESKLNVPKAMGHSDTGKNFLRLTSEELESKEKEENDQKQAGTFASDIQKKEAQFVGQFLSIVDPALQGQSGVRPVLANLPRYGKYLNPFPEAAQIPNLPDNAGHTPMPARLTRVSTQLGESFQSGSTIPLADPTNFLLTRNSLIGEENSFNSLQTSSSDKDLPSTVKQTRNQQAMSDNDLSSTPRQSFRPHSRFVSGLPSFDAFAARPDLHRMNAITREQQRRNTANSASTSLGRPSNISKAHMLALGDGSEPSGNPDSFVPLPGGAAIRQTASAGPPQPFPAPVAIPASRLPPNPEVPSSKTFYILTHYRLENLDKDLRYLIGTGPLVLPQVPLNSITFHALAQELNKQAHSLNNWYGLQEEMAKSTRTVPASATTPGNEQKLEFKRVVLRYDFGCGWDEETAGPYDTPISNTPELDRVLHLMARRNWRDPLVAYFGLGEPVPVMYYDNKGKGKRVESEDDDDRATKKSRTSRSSSIKGLSSSRTTH